MSDKLKGQSLYIYLFYIVVRFKNQIKNCIHEQYEHYDRNIKVCVSW